MRSKPTTPQRLFGEAVRAQRRRLGLSQEELAARSDLHTTFVSDIERGVTTGSIVTLSKISKGLSISAGELVTKAGL
jgi:transcriptional regulator with XRE-family HTH domain